MQPYGDYPDLRGVRRILVVKLRHLGDVLLSSALITNIKKAVPDARVDLLIYQEGKEILEGHPAINEFLYIDRGWKKLSLFQRLKNEFKLLLQIRKNSYDLVINLTEGDRGAVIALISSASIRVGLDPGKSGFLGKKKIYTHLVKKCKTPRHQVEKDLDALRRIGIFPTLEERVLHFAIPKPALDKMASYRGAIVIHAVSRWRFKCLPLESIRLLIEELLDLGEKVILTSGNDPVEVALLETLPCSYNLAGGLTLKELGALILVAKALITVDSLPLHMASALKTPVVALFGPSSELNWGPWMHKQSRVVVQNYSCRPCHLDGCGGSKVSDCLVTLPVKRILGSLEELLGGVVPQAGFCRHPLALLQEPLSKL